MTRFRYSLLTLSLLVLFTTGCATSPAKFSKECKVEDNYCLYTNVPRYIMYADRVAKISDNLVVSLTDRRLYFINEDKMNPDNYAINTIICKNTSQKPKIIKLFEQLAPKEVSTGWGHYRSAAVCGDVYFIEEYFDHTGPILYGPFRYFKNDGYTSDGKNIYINAYDVASSLIDNWQIAKNIDAQTFELLSDDSNYFKDKNGVYFNALRGLNLADNIKMLTNVDPKTVSVVSPHCLKDSNVVYCDELENKKNQKIRVKILPGADSETFSKIGEYEKYFKDKNNVFCNAYEKGVNIKKLKNVDVTSFELISDDSLDDFAKDKNSVFYRCDKLQNSDSGKR